MFTIRTKAGGFLLHDFRKVVFSLIVCSSLLFFLDCQVHGDRASVSTGNFQNSDAVREVLSNKDAVANASWWGFNVTDSTYALQSAINSGASTVIVPYMGHAWIVRPIKLANNQEIVFEPGVVVIAKKGEFRGKRDCLFSGISVENVTLRGYGATFRMHKKDYQSPRYTKAEWRHTLAFWGASDIAIYGLRLESSGGDGILIGGTRDGSHIPCKNILIKDCVCDNNHRQGISVTSVDRLRVENCVLRNTRGTQPKSGIDIEPGNYKCILSDIVVSNCISEGNAGAGFFCNISHLKAVSGEVSVLFVNCYARNCVSSGLYVRSDRPKNHPRGLVEFRNCTIEDIPYYGAQVLWSSTAPSMQVRFRNCKWRNVGQKRGTVPIRLDMIKRKVANQTGGAEFINCYVYDKKNRAFLRINEVDGGEGIYDVKGNINVYNPHGARIHSAKPIPQSVLRVRAFKVQE